MRLGDTTERWCLTRRVFCERFAVPNQKNFREGACQRARTSFLNS